MELPTAHTKSVRSRRRLGFTLPECLIATSLVAVSVAAVASTLDAVYKQERYIAQEARALASAKQLLEEVTARPITASTSGDITLASMNNYSDTVLVSTEPVVIDDATQDVVAVAQDKSTFVYAYGSKADYLQSSPTNVDVAVPIEVTQPATISRNVLVSTGAVTVAGRTETTGKLARVDVKVTMPGGKTITVRRLVTDAEKTGGSQ